MVLFVHNEDDAAYNAGLQKAILIVDQYKRGKGIFQIDPKKE